MSASGALPAGAFGDWLARLRAALAGRGEMDVACGTCTACCDSAHFVHVAPDEHDALAAIPRTLHAPAPGLPAGHVVLGYDSRGHCPLLGAGGCSIHARRPRTCRVYDCRVFAAAGIDADREAITARARRWVFDYPTAADRALHAAVRAAARFVREHAGAFAEGEVPRDPVGIALLAVAAVESFVDRDGELSPADVDALARAVLAVRGRATVPPPALPRGHPSR